MTQDQREAAFQALLRDPQRALAAALSAMEKEGSDRFSWRNRLGPEISDPATLCAIQRDLTPGIPFRHGRRLQWVKEERRALHYAASDVIPAGIGGSRGLQMLNFARCLVELGARLRRVMASV